MNPPAESSQPDRPSPSAPDSARLSTYRRQQVALRAHMLWLEEEIRLLEKAQSGPIDNDEADDTLNECDPAEVELELPSHNAPAITDLGRIRWGCALFALAAALLFLFLLFGLPYLIYPTGM